MAAMSKSNPEGTIDDQALERQLRSLQAELGSAERENEKQQQHLKELEKEKAYLKEQGDNLNKRQQMIQQIRDMEGTISFKLTEKQRVEMEVQQERSRLQQLQRTLMLLQTTMQGILDKVESAQDVGDSSIEDEDPSTMRERLVGQILPDDWRNLPGLLSMENTGRGNANSNEDGDGSGNGDGGHGKGAMASATSAPLPTIDYPSEDDEIDEARDERVSAMPAQAPGSTNRAPMYPTTNIARSSDHPRQTRRRSGDVSKSSHVGSGRSSQDSVSTRRSTHTDSSRSGSGGRRASGGHSTSGVSTNSHSHSQGHSQRNKSSAHHKSSSSHRSRGNKSRSSELDHQQAHSKGFDRREDRNSKTTTAAAISSSSSSLSQPSKARPSRSHSRSRSKTQARSRSRSRSRSAEKYHGDGISPRPSSMKSLDTKQPPTRSRSRSRSSRSHGDYLSRSSHHELEGSRHAPDGKSSGRPHARTRGRRSGSIGSAAPTTTSSTRTSRSSTSSQQHAHGDDQSLTKDGRPKHKMDGYSQHRGKKPSHKNTGAASTSANASSGNKSRNTRSKSQSRRKRNDPQPRDGAPKRDRSRTRKGDNEQRRRGQGEEIQYQQPSKAAQSRGRTMGPKQSSLLEQMLRREQDVSHSSHDTPKTTNTREDSS